MERTSCIRAGIPRHMQRFVRRFVGLCQHKKRLCIPKPTHGQARKVPALTEKSAGVGTENGKGVAESGDKGVFSARHKTEKRFAWRFFRQRRHGKRRRMRNVWEGKREKR